MNIGVHVSAAGDLSLAPIRAEEIGCECFQFFSRPPQGGPGKEITPELAKKFRENSEKFQMPSYLHAPYYINLASAEGRIYHSSISILREELERGSKLGVKYLMFHIGSSKDLDRQEALDKVTEGIFQIMENYKGSTELLIEIAAGSGNVIGANLEEVEGILSHPKLSKFKIGVCFDTCHAFASGYDLRDEKTVKATFAKFDKIIGLKKLKLIHANDSMADFDSKKDRHEHIGHGKIGLKGFKAIVAFAKEQNIDMILETQHDELLAEDIKILKKLRGKK